MANTWKTLDGVVISDIHDMLRSEIKKSNDNEWVSFAYVGTDGQDLSSRFTSFVQCIAIHRCDMDGIGKGGRVFYVRHTEKRYWDINSRLLREAELSIQLAQNISHIFKELHVPFEVHADVNSYAGDKNQNKSNQVHDVVKGWIAGLGFKCKTKPEAFVASIAADRHTRSVRHKKKSKYKD